MKEIIRTATNVNHAREQLLTVFRHIKGAIVNRVSALKGTIINRVRVQTSTVDFVDLARDLMLFSKGAFEILAECAQPIKGAAVNGMKILKGAIINRTLVLKGTIVGALSKPANAVRERISTIQGSVCKHIKGAMENAQERIKGAKETIARVQLRHYQGYYINELKYYFGLARVHVNELRAQLKTAAIKKRCRAKVTLLIVWWNVSADARDLVNRVAGTIVRVQTTTF